MTNEEMVADLKQFIAATVSQEVAGFEQRLSARIDAVEGRLDGMDQRFDSMDEKLNEIQNAVGERFDDHEHRIGRLERRAA
jgi:hypothetical protein